MFSFIKNIGSSISSGLSALCSSVGNIVRGIGSFAINFGPTIVNTFSKLNPILSVVATLVGILRPNEKIEEIGEKAIQAGKIDDIQLDKFERFDEYLEAIRNFELDPELSSSISAEEKQVAGVGIICKGIEEKFDLPEGTGGILASLIGNNTEYFNSDRIMNYLNSGNVVSLTDYFGQDKLQPNVIEKSIKDIISVEKKFGDNRNQETIFSDLKTIKDNLYRN